jgi:hypothetical protein
MAVKQSWDPVERDSAKSVNWTLKHEVTIHLQYR